MGAPGAPDDAHALAERLARWRRRFGDRPLYRVAAGHQWLRLHLDGDEHFCFLLTAMPGATALAGREGPLPIEIATALPAVRDHPCLGLLAGATLIGLGAIPGERVACFRLARPDGSPMHLLHQLFGSPGNTVLLDGGGNCLWAWRRPPHALLAMVPDRTVYDYAPADAVPAAEAADATEATIDRLATSLGHDLLTRLESSLGRRLRSAERLCLRLAEDLAEARRGDDHRRRAEALASQLHLLRPGSAQCEIVDPRDGQPVIIALNPALTPAANLKALFRLARKADRGLEIIIERLHQAELDTAVLREGLAGLSALSTLDGNVERSGAAADGANGLIRLGRLQAWCAEHPEFAPDGPTAPRRRAGKTEEPTRPFRRYLIDGRWEVWVGRSSRENDELTHRAAHSRDLWLHAHGASGSHVVVRTGGHPERVPRAVLEKAASLAALHSKARHSSLVSVIWTEKRFVRKPRKSPAGLAVCLRDATLMVEPKVADGVESV